MELSGGTNSIYQYRREESLYVVYRSWARHGSSFDYYFADLHSGDPNCLREIDDEVAARAKATYARQQALKRDQCILFRER